MEDENKSPIQTTLTNVKLEGYDDDRVFKLVTSLKDENVVSDLLVKGFASQDIGAKLVTYSVQTSLQPKPTDTSLDSPYKLQLKYVAFQETTTPPADQTEPTATTPADAATATEAAPPAEQAAAPESTASETTTPESAPSESAAPASGTESATPGSGDAATSAAATADAAPTVRTNVDLMFKAGGGEADARINAAALLEKLVAAGKDLGLSINPNQIMLAPKGATGWSRDSDVGYAEWSVGLPIDEARARELINKFEDHLAEEPIWQSVSKIDSRVAGEMQSKAILALVVSMVFIGAYIWFRFQKLSYGLAAILALVHDVLITLGFVAISHWLFRPLGFLLIDDFKISLNMVAAFLTIIGYSLNDTIVVFDRIREVKGKAPRLTAAMINQSVNQTLGRTLLTSSTTIFAIFLMYVFGGEAVHSFCYALLIGILVGTYSSVFIAAPLLLWFAQREEAKQAARAA